MADTGNTTSRVEVFLDEVRSKMSGSYDYTPKDANDKWVFAEVAVGNGASTDLLDTGDSYFGSSTQVATGDKVHWIAIKNTSTTTTEGVGFNVDGGDASYDEADLIVLGPEELLVLKIPNTTVANLHARSCILDGTYGYPNGQGSATITVLVAAILDDV